MSRFVRVSRNFLAILLLITWSALADGFRIQPHLQNITPDGATIIWETLEPGASLVEYGRGESLDRKVTAPEPVAIHRVRVTGLEAETPYAYRVAAGDDVFASQFTTAPATSREITFVVIGDTRRWENRFEETRMAEHWRQWNPEFFLNMGDLVPSGHNYEQWPEHFNRFADLNHRYMMVTARGNHEGSMLHDTENDWFAKYHELPGEGEPFASFDWGNTHFVVISYEQTGQAAPWLDKHLEAVDKQHVIVTQHLPMYCTGYASPTDSRKEPGQTYADLIRVMDKHGVDVNLSGHTHIYERVWTMRNGVRDDRNGVLYIVNGGDINANFPEPWTAFKDDRTTMEKPTYSVFHCKNDRIEIRTFCWSPIEQRIVEIDYHVQWRDESVPSAVLASLPERQGEELVRAIEELGAMAYLPAAPKLVPYLDAQDVAVRRTASRAIRLIGNGEVVKDLLAYLDDEDVEVRRDMARAFEIAMPEHLTKTIAAHVENSEEDEAVRISLLGALEFHAPQKVTVSTTVTLLEKPGAPPAVRERAAYALGRVASKSDVRKLTKLFEREDQPYVLTRLAYSLNSITGVPQSLDPKGPLLNSAPGKRREFVQKWLKGPRN